MGSYISPEFIGEYYRIEGWYGNDYYTNEVENESDTNMEEGDNILSESNDDKEESNNTNILQDN